MINNNNKDMPAIFLAPMAGYTDRAMRVVSHECGAEYLVTEMVSAKAVVYGDKKTHNLARIRADEGKTAVQIFGSDPDIMAEAAAMLEGGFGGEYVPPIAIDVNMGCPVNKIFGNGEGSALMNDPDLICRIVSSIKRTVKIPVTVKIRSGIDEKRINAVDCALAAECGGASLIAVHGRTRSQMYGGSADRKIIRNVKNSVQIPVIANGDIVSGESALAMLSETGADGIMIGRAAVGNPFIFNEVNTVLNGGTYKSPPMNDIVKMALRELELAVIDKGERVAIPEARKKIALYFKGFRGSAQLRAGINSATEWSLVKSLIESLYD